MKKLSLTIILITSCILLFSTYFVGEKTQKVLHEQLQNINNSAIQVESLSYQKSFFTAKSEIKIAVAVQGQSPLKLLIRSDITHYSYKAKAINHLLFLDQKLAKDLNQFFQTDQWLTSKLEMSLFSVLTGEFTLAEGVFNDQVGRVTLLPSQVLYSYNIKKKQGAFNLTWDGFNGEVDNGQLAINNMLVDATFSQDKKGQLSDLQYQLQFEKFDFTGAIQYLALKGVSLQGENEISENQFAQPTLNSKNNWQVKAFTNGQQQFTNNKMQLSLLDLNLAALLALKTSLTEKSSSPQSLSQAISELASLGGKIELDSLQSNTPWGKVTALLDMVIQPNVALKQVADNPISLIDYSDGQLSINLPEKLTQQPDIGYLLEMGLSSGVLKRANQQLTLEANLDRGELTINNKVIPL